MNQNKVFSILIISSCLLIFGLSGVLVNNLLRLSKVEEGSSSLPARNQEKDIEELKQTIPEVYQQAPGGSCETGFELTTVTTASCAGLKIYSNSWQQITDLTTLNRGDSINLVVAGTSNQGNFTQGRFRINQGSWQISTSQQQGGFSLAYTVPADLLQVVIESQIYHDELGWQSSSQCNKTLLFEEQYQCDNIATNNQNPQRGESIIYTCTGSGDNIATAKFRVLLNGTPLSGAEYNKTENLNIVGQTGTAQYVLQVPSTFNSGSYTVQCQICQTNGNCTAWGQSQ